MEASMALRQRTGDGGRGGGRGPKLQVIAVSSGKGGVGKTNVVANLALALVQTGKRVLVLDADLGLGNLDVLLGLAPLYTLEHVFAGEKSLAEIVVAGPGGIGILPATCGVQDLTALTPPQQMLLQEQLDRMANKIDVLLIDTGAGISSNVLFFTAAAQEILVVVSPEPTSITDAYALMKVLSHRYGETRFRLLVNMVRSRREASEVHRKISNVADKFLNIAIDFVGWIPSDDYVPLAVTRQRAVVDLYPQAPASREFHRLAAAVRGWETSQTPKGTVQFLWHRLLESSPR